jgi:hypothetical protein
MATIKVAVNAEYGGFGLHEPKFVRQFRDCDIETRANPMLIDFIEQNIDSIVDIVLVEIPADATDYLFTEEDGFETLYYVQNGKIHVAEEIEAEEDDD